MKLNKFLLSAIAAASLTACSDSPEIVDNNKGHRNADGTGYVSLSISMPNSTSNETRADANNPKNDDFEYGEDNKEYAVNKAILLIFTAQAPTSENPNLPAEDTFTFEAAYDMTPNFIKEDNGQIGATSKVTQKINQIADNKIAKALVILNPPSDTNNAITVVGTGLNIKGSEFSGTFADFKQETDELPTTVAKGFTMTNAPLTTAQSTSSTEPSGSTSTLADIDKTKILPTQEQASTQPASTIYVERSVAKVTVNNNITTAKPLPENSKFNIEIKSFALNNTNKESHIVRNVDNSWNTYVSQASSVSSYDDKYRFVGYKEPITFNGENHYRTYWAKDPNYDGNATLEKNLPTNWEETFGSTHPLYCLENTFNVASQTHRNTTRVVVKAEIKDKNNTGDAETLYMWNNDANTLANINAFKTTTTGGTSTVGSAVKEANKLYDVIATGKTIKEIGLSTNDGYVTVSSITFDGEAAISTGAAFDAVKNYFGKIAKYEGGKVYYSVLIKHFGDRLTPWNTWEADPNKPAAGGIDQIYPTTNRDANYLGRYGVVRNNWYEINLNKINKIGTPDIDYDNDTPDDELNSYISVSINILSWAKRKQNVDLQ